MNRETFIQKYTELVDHVKPFLVEAGLKVFDKLTEKEAKQLNDNALTGFRLPKIILCALSPELFESQWGCEAVVKDVKKVKRLNKQRRN